MIKDFRTVAFLGARFWKKRGIISSAESDGGKACYGPERVVAKQKWWCKGIKQSLMVYWPEMGDKLFICKESGETFLSFYNGRFTMNIGLSSPQWLSESRGQHLLRSYSIFREEMKWHTSFIGFWKVANCSLGSICLLKVPRKPVGVVIHPLRVTSHISVYQLNSYIFLNKCS